VRWPAAGTTRDAAVGSAVGLGLMAACFAVQKAVGMFGMYETPAFLQAAFMALNVPAIAIANAVTFLLVIVGWSPPRWVVLSLWFVASAAVYAATWVVVRGTGHGRWPRVAVLSLWAIWIAIVIFFFLGGAG